MSSSFSLNIQPLTGSVQNLRATLPDRCRAALLPLAPQITAWMQANHGWQNRTGAAEAGLNTEVEAALNEIIVAFAHDPSLDYPWWLETKFGGRDGVIRPAMDVWGPRIMEALRGVL